MVLGLILVGCMPQEMTEEEELNRARAEKIKHPEQWRKLEKYPPSRPRNSSESGWRWIQNIYKEATQYSQNIEFLFFDDRTQISA